MLFLNFAIYAATWRDNHQTYTSPLRCSASVGDEGACQIQSSSPKQMFNVQMFFSSSVTCCKEVDSIICSVIKANRSDQMKREPKKRTSRGTNAQITVALCPWLTGTLTHEAVSTEKWNKPQKQTDEFCFFTGFDFGLFIYGFANTLDTCYET